MGNGEGGVVHCPELIDRLLAGGPQLSYGPERTAEEGSAGAFLI